MTEAVTVDKGFSLIDMALQFRNLRSENLTFLTSPNIGQRDHQRRAVVVSDREKALAMYKAMSADTHGGLGQGQPAEGQRRRLTERTPARRPVGAPADRVIEWRRSTESAKIDCRIDPR